MSGVDISVHDGTLVIAPAGQARRGWDTAFREMASRGDDAPLDGDAITSEASDEEPWEWK